MGAEAGLASALNNLAADLSALGRHEEALTVAMEAVTTYRELARANPGLFETKLAAALNSLADRQAELDQ